MDSGSTFNPTINKSVGRVSWDMGDNGGYNGIAAIDSLTGITNNWSITTS